MSNLMTETEVAKRLHVPGIDPPLAFGATRTLFAKFGALVRYRPGDLDAG